MNRSTIRLGFVRPPGAAERTGRMRLMPRRARLVESDDLELWTLCRRLRGGDWVVRKRYVQARCPSIWRLSWVE